MPDTRQEFPLIANLPRRISLRFPGYLVSRWLEDALIDNRACRLAEQFLFDISPGERSTTIFQGPKGPLGSAL